MAAKKKSAAAPPALNPEQKAVSLHRGGPLLVSSGAGTGKTSAVVERIVNLIQSGVPPYRILVLSFSQTAAKEIGKRLKIRLPDVETDGMFRTFHSLALEIHKEENGDTSHVLDHNQAITRFAFRRARDSVDGAKRRVPWEAFKLFSSNIKNDFLGRNPVFAMLGAADDRMMALADRVASLMKLPSGVAIWDVYQAYEQMRRQGTEIKLAKDADPQVLRWSNFDELLYDAAWMLTSQDRREKWQSHWDYIIQDEAQDMCETQSVIAEALSAQHRNYMVVGDVAQCVFTWRGARPEKLLGFGDRWKNSRVITLDRNYRSGKAIIEAANAMLRSMADYERLPIQLRGERSDNGFVAMHEFESYEDQADAIAKNCRAHHYSGVEWKEMAVLVRTIAQAGAIEVALNAADVPTKSIGSSMFDLPAIRTLMSWYRLAIGKPSPDDVHEALCYPYSNRIDREFADTVVKKPREENASWLDHVDALANEARNTRAVDSWMETAAKLQQIAPSRTPGQLLIHIGHSVCSDIVQDAISGEDNDADETHKKLIDLAASYASHDLFTDKLDRMLANREKHKRARNVVVISTIHGSKGDEWPVVFLPGVAQGSLPHRTGDPEEEKRLFYVAITRARDELWMSRAIADMYGETLPSQFIQTVGTLVQHEYHPGVQRRDKTQMSLI